MHNIGRQAAERFELAQFHQRLAGVILGQVNSRLSSRHLEQVAILPVERYVGGSAPHDQNAFQVRTEKQRHHHPGPLRLRQGCRHFQPGIELRRHAPLLHIHNPARLLQPADELRRLDNRLGNIGKPLTLELEIPAFNPRPQQAGATVTQLGHGPDNGLGSIPPLLFLQGFGELQPLQPIVILVAEKVLAEPHPAESAHPV